MIFIKTLDILSKFIIKLIFKQRNPRCVDIKGENAMVEYDARYELDLIRGIQEPRPWDIVGVIAKHLTYPGILLDIGCGTAFKILPLATMVSIMYGLEPNEKMLSKAYANIGDGGVTNMRLVRGQCEEIPFPNESFNFVTCIMAPHVTDEVYRVLKPGGIAILEKLDDRDKLNFKQEFSDDEQGPRGQNSHFELGERAQIYQDEFNPLFSSVEIEVGFWKTWYTLEGLTLFLEQTSTVRDFDREKDQEALTRIQNKFTTPKGIETTQGHILIVAKK